MGHPEFYGQARVFWIGIKDRVCVFVVRTEIEKKAQVSVARPGPSCLRATGVGCWFLSVAPAPQG